MPSLPQLTCLLVAAVLTLLPYRLSADDTIYTKVDVNPVPVKTPPPEYPEEMRRLGVSGVVAVTIILDEKGAVTSASVVKSSRSEFEAPALAAVKKWTFKPGKKDGVPVKVRVTVPPRFDLDE